MQTHKVSFEYWRKEGHDPEIELHIEGYSYADVKIITTALTEMILKLKEVK